MLEMDVLCRNLAVQGTRLRRSKHLSPTVDEGFS